MEFTSTPLTPNCSRVFAAGHHVVVGVSLGNSYFSGDVLSRLLQWLHMRFSALDVVITDSPFLNNLLVAGHPETYAKKKTAREASTAQRRIRRSWREAGIPSPVELHVHLLSELADNDVYRRLRTRTDRALTTDSELRRTCLRMSEAALRAYLGGEAPSPDQAEAGMQYLAAELPFFIGSAEMFGASSSMCFYHRPVPAAELLFARTGYLRPPLTQGYALICPAQPSRIVSPKGGTPRVCA
jgi:cyclo(L-tyrosyl-L-tyrosyl) synthase